MVYSRLCPADGPTVLQRRLRHLGAAVGCGLLKLKASVTLGGMNSCSVSPSQSFTEVIPGAAASVPPSNFSKMQIPGPQPRSPVSEVYGGGAGEVEIYVSISPLAVPVQVPLLKKRTPGFSGRSALLT